MASPILKQAIVNYEGARSDLIDSFASNNVELIEVAYDNYEARYNALVALNTATAGRQSITWTGLVGASATGLANDATAYTATMTIDGVVKNISVVGSAAQTFTTLIAEINTDLGGDALASIASAQELRVTSDTTGAASTVVIASTGTLWPAVNGYGQIQNTVGGRAALTSTFDTVVAYLAALSTEKTAIDVLYAAEV